MRSSKIPATGLNKNVTVKFKHGYYVKLDLVLFKSFTSAGHMYEELVLLFFSTLSIQYMFKTLFD